MRRSFLCDIPQTQSINSYLMFRHFICSNFNLLHNHVSDLKYECFNQPTCTNECNTEHENLYTKMYSHVSSESSHVFQTKNRQFDGSENKYSAQLGYLSPRLQPSLAHRYTKRNVRPRADTTTSSRPRNVILTGKKKQAKTAAIRPK